MVLTTSWDDGHPLDSRLADMLARYELPATFYVPIENPERPLLPPADVRRLAEAGLEIGGHTYHHTRLLNVSLEVAREEIADGKAALEDLLGSRVLSFSYVGGQHSPRIAALVREAGFLGARTTLRHRLWQCSQGADHFAMPTTLQAREFTTGEEALKLLGSRDLAALPHLLTGNAVDIVRAARFWLNRAERRGGVWHLWGHSWEIDRFGLWGQVEQILRLAAETRGKARWLTNGQLLAECAQAAAPETPTP